MDIVKGSILGNSGVGIFGFGTNSYVLVPYGIKETTLQIIKSTLETSIIQLSIANTVLIGTMVSGNSQTLLIPFNTTDNEYERLQPLTESGIEIVEIESKYTALGNLILANDKGAIISDTFEKKAQKQISDALGVETIAGKIMDSPLVGTMGTVTNRGCLVHPLLSKEEIMEISSILHVNVDLCTVNRGIPYPKVGIIANSRGALIGEDTTGPESMRIFEVLFAPY
ncbi:MAG: translation initiation factor IF-6 [Candidatus Heimdallarchaeaceae archaeon]